ncbi:phosphotransferase family protein [Kribbella sp. CA-247076]|uniref:phosphotransferase family protein n=1 Tax=Kribbella sp. CA-247076 TaxID=3239941 RepID=UPI003D8BD3C2
MPHESRTPLTESAAVAHAAVRVGPIVRVEPVQGFAGNRTYRLHTAAGPVVYLKSGASVEAEARVCRLARSAGVPAPEILHVEPTYLLAAEIPGGASTSPTVLTEAGRRLRRMNELHGDANWAKRLSEPINHLDTLTGILPPALIRRLREVVPPFVDSVAHVDPVLLHADLHPRHLYAVGNDLTGILDWGDAMYGDPLFDLARFTMSGPEATKALLAGYDLDVTGLEQTFSMYRALWALMAIHAEHTAGGTWITPHITTITHELAR